MIKSWTSKLLLLLSTGPDNGASLPPARIWDCSFCTSLWDWASCSRVWFSSCSSCEIWSCPLLGMELVTEGLLPLRSSWFCNSSWCLSVSNCSIRRSAFRNLNCRMRQFFAVCSRSFFRSRYSSAWSSLIRSKSKMYKSLNSVSKKKNLHLPEVILQFVHFVHHLSHIFLKFFILLHQFFDESLRRSRFGPYFFHSLKLECNRKRSVNHFIGFNRLGENRQTLCVCADEGRDSNSRSSSVTRSSADRLSSIKSSLVVSNSRILCCNLILSDPVPPFIPILRNFLFDSSSFSRSRRSHRALYLSISFFMLFTWSWMHRE